MRYIYLKSVYIWVLKEYYFVSRSGLLLGMLKFPEFIGIKLPAGLVEAARQQAAADDRTLSAYLRRIITAAVQPERESEPPKRG